ncbi:hypothetical protein [Undibacterium oligocarboniphilum]|uniref:Uncharacterized protein n=1 Tax=Undibacterium oligocarboniphilum TaxID=666702 RepID=A0A850QJJ8_9BURK|nr:hypothetical protein [Undibacterium oligocarboniphilum]MBC3868614.1 hypothetical protein [Undibacterium oligocarboniphilum]NVO76594.1 hypothetical protein [Undibacterium oligocarboniphilum]
MQLRKILIQFFAFASVLVAGGAYAHTDEYLDTQKAPHGGQLRMAGIYHFELVVAKDSKQSKGNPVVVYVTDHAGAKISTAGATGTVTLLVGKTKTTLNLTPDGENALKASGNYASAPEMKAVVSVTLAGKATEQARFTPLSNT